MKKIFFSTFLILLGLFSKAQYNSINAILDELEARKGINQNLKKVDLNNKKFISVKDFDDHTERKFIIINGKSVTYVEVFDDKESGQSTSNVFTGDIVRNNKNVVSLRADRLEGQKIPIPVTKTMLLTRQKKIIYLIDMNTKERWIDELSFSEAQK